MIGMSADPAITNAATSNIERTLLDTLDRLRRNPEGRYAIHLHLSQLQPANRQPERLRLVVQLFRPLEVGHRCQIFLLAHGDIMVLTFDITPAEVRRMVARVRGLFEDDPLTYDQPEDGRDPLATLFDLTTQLYQVEQVIGALLERTQNRRRRPQVLGTGGESRERRPEPLDPRRLAALQERLNTIDIGPFLVRQPVLAIEGARQASLVFEELYVGITELQAAISPETVLTGDRWLFQDFSRRLDRLVLMRLARTVSVRGPWDVSLNLNLESLASPTFADFSSSLESDQRILVEVQGIDLFNNVSSYLIARDHLRAKGHAVVVDGVTHSAMRLLDLGLLDPDYIKVMWSHSLDISGNPRMADAARAEIARLGPERIILARCDAERALAWGLSLGITMFQGRYPEAMLGAATMEGCPARAQCTLSQCVTRRAGVAGPVPLTCPNPPRLHAVTYFKASRMSPPASGES